MSKKIGLVGLEKKADSAPFEPIAYCENCEADRESITEFALHYKV